MTAHAGSEFLVRWEGEMGRRAGVRFESWGLVMKAPLRGVLPGDGAPGDETCLRRLARVGHQPAWRVGGLGRAEGYDQASRRRLGLAKGWGMAA